MVYKALKDFTYNDREFKAGDEVRGSNAAIKELLAQGLVKEKEQQPEDK